jgi:hypothetical protein
MIIWSDVEIDRFRCSILDGPDPAAEAHAAEDAQAGQFEVGVQVVPFVVGHRESELGLEDAHAGHVQVDDRLLEFGEADAGRLHAVPIGHVNQVNRRHGGLRSR